MGSFSANLVGFLEGNFGSCCRNSHVSLLKPLPSSVDSLPLTNGSLKIGDLLPNDDVNYTFQ